MRSNYLFGPFIGETIYELNYFVGHAIYLRKQNPNNRIIVLTRKENFDLYGKYATTLIPLPISDELESYKFGCRNIMATLFDEIVRKFKMKYHNKIKISDHFYPNITTHLKDVKWYYPRNEIDFEFHPRPRNKIIAKDMCGKGKKFIISDFKHRFGIKISSHLMLPTTYFFNDLDVSKVENVSTIGILIECIRMARYVYADIDSLAGRLAMLMKKPLITKREFLDVKYLSPINPYGSIVIGSKDLKEGIEYLEANYEDHI